MSTDISSFESWNSLGSANRPTPENNFFDSKLRPLPCAKENFTDLIDDPDFGRTQKSATETMTSNETNQSPQAPASHLEVMLCRFTKLANVTKTITPTSKLEMPRTTGAATEPHSFLGYFR